MSKIPKPSAIVERQWKVIDKLKSTMFKQNTINSKLQVERQKAKKILRTITHSIDCQCVYCEEME